MNPKRIFPKFLQILTFHTEKGKEGGGGEKHCVMMIKTIRYAKKKIGAPISTIHSFHKRQFFTFLEIPQNTPPDFHIYVVSDFHLMVNIKNNTALKL